MWNRGTPVHTTEYLRRTEAQTTLLTVMAPAAVSADASVIWAAHKPIAAISSAWAWWRLFFHPFSICSLSDNVWLIINAPRLTPGFVFSLEICKVSLIVGIFSRLLILGKLSVVVVLHGLTSALKSRFLIRWENLPFLTDSLGDLSEAVVLAFQAPSHFCDCC